MTVFFRFGSLSSGQNIAPTSPDKLMIPTDTKPPIQAIKQFHDHRTELCLKKNSILLTFSIRGLSRL